MENCFNPKEVHVLAKVIDEACLKLGIVDAMTKENIAARVLKHAAKDERDFDALLSVALNGRVIPMQPPKRQNFKGKSPRNVMHRMTQAERARTIAAQFGPSAVADILEVHAQLCERNAAKMVLKGPRRQK